MMIGTTQRGLFVALSGRRLVAGEARSRADLLTRLDGGANRLLPRRRLAATTTTSTPNNEEEKRKPSESTSKTEAEKDNNKESAATSAASQWAEKAREAVRNVAKSRFFQADQTTWRDAMRNVFGLPPVDAKVEKVDPSILTKPTMTPTSPPETPNAPPDAASRTMKTPEEEAHEWKESHTHAPAEPTLYEKQLKELGDRISALELEREEAQSKEDMTKYKEVNKEIRKVRKEMEGIIAKMNTTAVVAVEEKKGAWEQFSDTLRDTPLLKGIFGLGQTKAAKRITDVAEDAREIWETSQHPLMYRAHMLWDSVFAETEMGEAIRAFREKDPTFTVEDFATLCETRIIPTVLGAYLRGDLKTLERWCGEGAYAAVRAAVEERNRAGRKMDVNILNVQHVTVAAAKVVEKMGPLIVIQFMVQQIDCLYDLNGKVVEGDDNRVAAVFYAFAMTREREGDSQDEGPLKWVIKEFAILGTQQWV